MLWHQLHLEMLKEMRVRGLQGGQIQTVDGRAKGASALLLFLTEISRADLQPLMKETQR